MEQTIPIGFGGGLTKFKEEYNSKLKMSPNFVIVLIILVILFVAGLNFIS